MRVSITYYFITGLLHEAIENHFKNHRGMSFGATYLAALNPDFLLLIVNECLLYAPNQVISMLYFLLSLTGKLIKGYYLKIHHIFCMLFKKELLVERTSYNCELLHLDHVKLSHSKGSRIASQSSGS